VQQAIRPLGLSDALVLGVVEGLTEFLPISSTGHLILTGRLLGHEGELAKTFEIVIQLGAILAVVWLYRARLWALARGLDQPAPRQLVAKLFVAFLPAAFAGLLLHRPIKLHLFDPAVVAWALVAGGLAILLIERRDHSQGVDALDQVSLRQALTVGLAQTLALIPGVSRAGATIMGALLVGLRRTTATEFSFFLAIPTIGAATLFDLAKHHTLFAGHDAAALALGLLTALITAVLVIRWLLSYVSRRDFSAFGYYRIALGALTLLYFKRGAR